MAPPRHATQRKQVWLKSGYNEGHFTLQAETVFRPYLPSHCSGVGQIYHMAHTAHVLRAVYISLNWESNMTHFTLEAKEFFVPVSPCITVGWAKCATWHSLGMRYKHCKLGWFRSVIKGTLLLRPKQFLCPYHPSHYSWVTEKYCMALAAHALRAVQVRLNLSIMKGNYTHDAENVLRPYPPPTAVGGLKIPHGTPCACVTCIAS
jgi:hypothetical protein